MSLKKLVEAVRKNKSFLITTHTSPEGDALGSELAMLFLLRSLKKKVAIVNQDAVPYEYSFLPNIEEVKIFNKKINLADFDCLLIVDCSDLKRCGQLLSSSVSGLPIINIDHHISNEIFGDVNWVDPKASACCELVYKLFKELKVPINKDIATFLYVGIMTDTGSFRYSNTTGYTHKVASDLVGRGLDIPFIFKKIYGSIPISDALFLTKVFPTMKLECRGRLAWFQIARKELKIQNTAFDFTENILSFARSIKGVEVVALFRELPERKNTIRVNLRSQGKVDVNKIASLFGGGGHKTASGCTVNGTLEGVRRAVLSRIRKSIIV